MPGREVEQEGEAEQKLGVQRQRLWKSVFLMSTLEGVGWGSQDWDGGWGSQDGC